MPSEECVDHARVALRGSHHKRRDAGGVCRFNRRAGVEHSSHGLPIPLEGGDDERDFSGRGGRGNVEVRRETVIDYGRPARFDDRQYGVSAG